MTKAIERLEIAVPPETMYDFTGREFLIEGTP